MNHIVAYLVMNILGYITRKHCYSLQIIMASLCFHIITTYFYLLVLTLLSDLGLILILFCVSSVCFTAFISVCDFALRQHVFCFVTSRAHLRRAQQRLKGALVLDDKGIANMTSGEPMGQLR